MSAIVGMSCSEILDFHTSRGTTCGSDFHHYVVDALLPYLQPFNGVNQHSIVVLDNASIHHVPQVISTLQGAGVLVQFLPSYSPDYNPIEMVFAKAKSVLKLHEQAWQDLDTETLLIAALNLITKEDCEGYISYCGY